MRSVKLNRRSVADAQRLHQHFAELERAPRPRAKSRVAPDDAGIGGTVAPGFEPVLQAFRDNFSSRGEVGAAFAAYHRGRLVVDLWGGARTRGTALRWQESTLAPLRSAGAALPALCCALAHSRGWLRYDQPVAGLWPEFADTRTTVRQLLSHQSGLCAPDAALTPKLLRDAPALAQALARQKPQWKPGERYGYHAATLDLYVAELIRRCDPQQRPLARFFAEEIAQPLEAEVHFAVPGGARPSGVARICAGSPLDWLDRLETMSPGYVLASAWPASLTRRALAAAAPAAAMADLHALFPSEYAVATARGLARVYGAFSNSAELGLHRETLDELEKPATLPWSGTKDGVLKMDVAYSLGFWKKLSARDAGARAGAYGVPMLGGGLACADPQAQLAMCYLPNRLGPHVYDEPRTMHLADTLYRCV